MIDSTGANPRFIMLVGLTFKTFIRLFLGIIYGRCKKKKNPHKKLG